MSRSDVLDSYFFLQAFEKQPLPQKSSAGNKSTEHMGGGGFWLVCLDAFWGSSIDFVLIKAFVAWAENNC